MRDRGHDGQKAQRRVKSAFLKAVPAQRTGKQVGPERQPVAHPGRVGAQLVAPIHPTRTDVEQDVGAHRCTQRQQQPFGRQIARGVEDRQNDQACRIIGNRQEQQEPHRRVTCAKDDAPHQIRKGNVCCRRDGPSAGHCIIGVAAQKRGQAQINRNRAEHPACCGKQRGGGFLAAQRAVFQDHRLPDLFGSNRKEKGHQDVIDQIMGAQNLADITQFGDAIILAIALQPIAGIRADPVVKPDRIFDEVVIGVRIGIGPNQCDQRAGNQ